MPELTSEEANAIVDMVVLDSRNATLDEVITELKMSIDKGEDIYVTLGKIIAMRFPLNLTN